jgi:hypothetical protein
MLRLTTIRHYGYSYTKRRKCGSGYATTSEINPAGPAQTGLQMVRAMLNLGRLVLLAALYFFLTEKISDSI